MTGYNQNFFSGFELPLPKLTTAQKKLRASFKDNAKKFELQYTHFSIVQNKARKFAFYAATNIDGSALNVLVKERNDFTAEPQLAVTDQTGNELYDFDASNAINDFDKGHIAKFQDPQWGDEAIIRQAAEDTMRFPNCVPQHQTLNRGAWKSLEDYIIKKFTRKTGENGRKISVFAGPLLLQNDPFYIDKIKGETIQIPCHFWKVIVYPNRQNQLSAAGFLMSQKSILFKYGFVVEKKDNVREAQRPALKAEREFFTDFTSGEPYQVRIDFLEQTTGFSFGVDDLFQPYTKEEATELIFKRVEVPVKSLAALASKDRPLRFEFEGITL
jgi:endonuclease G